MCEQCASENTKFLHQGISIGIQTGAEAGIKHLEHLDTYYPGMSNNYVEYDELKKHISISPTGITTKHGEDPVDKYIDELLEELRVGLREGNKREHIKQVFQKFSGRKFEDQAWWGNLTDSEMEELLAGVRSYWLPHTAMLNSGLSEAFIFGKFSKQLTENMSLEAARKKIKGLELSKFDAARVDYIQKNAGLFWDKAIDREQTSAVMQLLKYNRDVTTEILKNPDQKSWRSLTSDVYHSIKKDESIVLRDLDRIVRTETAAAQNHAILVAGQESGAKYFFVQVRPTACKICRGMYLDKDGKPKRFKIDDFIDQPRDINWGKKPKDFINQPPPAHVFCYCRSFIE